MKLFNLFVGNTTDDGDDYFLENLFPNMQSMFNIANMNVDVGLGQALGGLFGGWEKYKIHDKRLRESLK